MKARISPGWERWSSKERTFGNHPLFADDAASFDPFCKFLYRMLLHEHWHHPVLLLIISFAQRDGLGGFSRTF
jgi:hypothetical protein